jgi:hypothetical protein
LRAEFVEGAADDAVTLAGGGVEAVAVEDGHPAPAVADQPRRGNKFVIVIIDLTGIRIGKGPADLLCRCGLDPAVGRDWLSIWDSTGR